MRTAIEQAEGRKLVARLSVMNARWHLDDVATRFGRHTPEYALAAEVLRQAERAFVAACDALVPLYAAGSPTP